MNQTSNKPKKIESIIPPPPHHWVGNGFKVNGFFPGGLRSESRMSPFFLLDYNAKMELPPSEKPRGVGVHPHRGFETVTIAYHGKVEHHDSAGNHDIIGEGDVQWMTAASGILHKEYIETDFNKKGGAFQMVQLWVNLPAKDKMTNPKYQPITYNNFGKFNLPDNKGIVNVIAGNFNGINGAAYTFSPMNVYDIKLNAGSSLKIELPENYNTGILVIEGDAVINEQKVPENNFVLFKNKGTEVVFTAITNCTFLVLSGEPINEPIAAHGPFLMNTDKEIQDAIDDYYSGKFGHLED
ncbi:MAG: pirin family protein [Bacteroidia bacterium]|nr:pirin family protein [Bacteroidia bacterium]